MIGPPLALVLSVVGLFKDPSKGLAKTGIALSVVDLLIFLGLPVAARFLC
jgi:hypothetical protein